MRASCLGVFDANKYKINLNVNDRQIEQIDIEEVQKKGWRKPGRCFKTSKDANDVIGAFLQINGTPCALPFNFVWGAITSIGSMVIGSSFLGKETRLTHQLVGRHIKLEHAHFNLEKTQEKVTQLQARKDAWIQENGDKFPQPVKLSEGMGVSETVTRLKQRDQKKKEAAVNKQTRKLQKKEKSFNKEIEKETKKVEKFQKLAERRKEHYDATEDTFRVFMEAKLFDQNPKEGYLNI